MCRWQCNGPGKSGNRRRNFSEENLMLIAPVVRASGHSFASTPALVVIGALYVTRGGAVG